MRSSSVFYQFLSAGSFREDASLLGFEVSPKRSADEGQCFFKERDKVNLNRGVNGQLNFSTTVGQQSSSSSRRSSNVSAEMRSSTSSWMRLRTDSFLFSRFFGVKIDIQSFEFQTESDYLFLTPFLCDLNHRHEKVLALVNISLFIFGHIRFVVSGSIHSNRPFVKSCFKEKCFKSVSARFSSIFRRPASNFMRNRGRHSPRIRRSQMHFSVKISIRSSERICWNSSCVDNSPFFVLFSESR